MKNYRNGMKATEFNKTQVAELAQKANVEKWLFDHLMRLAGYYGYDDNRGVEEEEREILSILEEENSIEITKKIGRYSERTIKAYSMKRAELDHSIVGAEVSEEEAEQKIIAKYPNCKINITEENCEFQFDTTKKNAKVYTYKVTSLVELAKKMNIIA